MCYWNKSDDPETGYNVESSWNCIAAQLSSALFLLLGTGVGGRTLKVPFKGFPGMEVMAASWDRLMRLDNGMWSNRVCKNIILKNKRRTRGMLENINRVNPESDSSIGNVMCIPWWEIGKIKLIWINCFRSV